MPLPNIMRTSARPPVDLTGAAAPVGVAPLAPPPGGNAPAGGGAAPAGGVRTKSLSSFSMAKQTQTLWCWSAVGTSVHRFFNSGSAWTQCLLASAVLGQPTCCTNPSGTACNRVYFLDKALAHTSNLYTWGGSATFAQVEAQVNADRPLVS